MNKLTTKQDITKAKIIRALLCASGEHEAWERVNVWDGDTDVVRLSIDSDMHAEIHCAVCKHCRTLYVRKRSE